MASAASQHIQQFVRSIATDIKLYKQLLDLLKQQKSLYLTFDSQALGSNIQQQMPIIQQLSRSASERTNTLRALGLPNNKASAVKIFNALPSHISEQVKKQWSLLETLIKQCQQHNQSNGQSSAAFHELINQLKQPATHTYEEQAF